MKKWALFFGILCVGGAAFTFLDKSPQLKVPTAQALQAAFPGKGRSILEHSDKFVLLSIDPTWGYDGKNKFHGYRVIGQTQANPEIKAKLIATLYDAMAKREAIGACFSPRHGIHAEKNGSSIDLLICFHCGQFEVYPGKNDHPTGIAALAQPTFDRVLKDAGISLSPH